jgi:hypothetical protein
MTHGKLALAMVVAALLVAPSAYAKKKPVTPAAASAPSSNSQAGGLPATNARVTALESAVGKLQTDLAAEIAARKAADAAFDTKLAALEAKITAVPEVFVGDGGVLNISGATVTIATKTVPAGNYFVLAAVQMINGSSAGLANARCVMNADGNLLADTSDLEFPILTTAGDAVGSTMFAPLQGTYTSAAPITISVACTESKGAGGALNASAQIAAVKAGTVQ